MATYTSYLFNKSKLIRHNKNSHSTFNDNKYKINYILKKRILIASLNVHNSLIINKAHFIQDKLTILSR